MDRPAFSLDDFLPYRLAVAASRISRAFSERYASAHGLSIAEWRVLAHLSQGGETSVREITAKVDMEKSKVSRAVVRLEEAGLLKKAENATDRRLLRLSLTDAGWETMKDLAVIADAFQAELLQALGSDAPAFARGLDRISGETR